MDTGEIKSIILELTSEDAHGSWELWGQVSSHAVKEKTTKLKELFIDCIETLLKEEKIRVENHTSDGKYIPVSYARSELEYEIKNFNNPEPTRFYWFSSTHKGMVEDIADRH